MHVNELMMMLIRVYIAYYHGNNAKMCDNIMGTLPPSSTRMHRECPDKQLGGWVVELMSTHSGHNHQVTISTSLAAIFPSHTYWPN
jgi:hypothetical protein